METKIVVIGAYGRDYEKAVDAIEDWNKGLDFFLVSNDDRLMRTYCSHRDFDSGTEVTIRFNFRRCSTTFNMEK